MSTIKLTGTSSGSSIIKAPDSGSTNQTFTLPAATGTLATTTEVALKAPIADPTFTGNVVSVITPNTEQGEIAFGDPEDANIGRIAYNHPSNFLATVVNATEYMRIHSNGVTSIPSGVALGVAVSANTASNVLDDYEEGTHTTAITMASGTATLNLKTLAYTKIGRQVTVSGQINISAVSSPSGQFQISLPFTVGTAEQFFSAGNYRTYSIDTPNDGVSNVIYSDRGTAKANLEWSRDAASPTNENATNGGYFLIGLTYFTD